MEISTLTFPSMKFLATFTLLALLASANAHSAGWSPGQKSPDPQQPVASKPVSEPAKATTLLSLLNLFDTSKILKSGPSVALFNRFGINITERLDAASPSKIWDNRVPLITDDNYEDLIVNEALTEQEEIDRVWIIVISVTSQKTDGVSKFLDNVFDSAFNQSQITGDIPHVRWGRMDYLNVTRITTKWAVWQAPYLVVLKDRGKTLRFYRPRNLRLQEDALLEFLKTDGWKPTPPWSSSYAPGGSNEYILDFFAVWLTEIYNITVLIPRWILVFGSGTIASLIIGLLHKSPPNPPPVAATQSQSTTTTTTVSTKSTDAPAQSDGAKRTGAKQRKSKA